MSERATEMSAGSSSRVQVLLWAAIPVIAIVGYGLVFLQAFNTVGCEGVCHDNLIFGTFALFPPILLGAVVIALGAGGVLAILRRKTLWVAVAGVATVVVIVATALIVLQVGFAPMWERNRQVATSDQPPIGRLVSDALDRSY